MFRRAIELDPGYAQAHAGLADINAQRILWHYVDAATALPEATAAASRALDLAADLAEAHVAQGHVRSLAGDGDGAIRSFERAIELNPELHEAHYYFARHLFAQGHYARAAKHYDLAWRTRTEEAGALALAVNALDASGDRRAGDAMARRALSGLQRQSELEPENARHRYLAAALHLRFGDAASGRALVDEAMRLGPDDFGTLYNAACFHAQAGDTDRALELLERGMRAGGGYPDWIINDPDLVALHGHPRFDALLAKLG